MQHATGNTQHATRSMQYYAACNVTQHAMLRSMQSYAACSMQHAACNRQHTTGSMQQAACNRQKAACSMQPAEGSMQHAACNRQHATHQTTGRRCVRAPSSMHDSRTSASPLSPTCREHHCAPVRLHERVLIPNPPATSLTLIGPRRQYLPPPPLSHA